MNFYDEGESFDEEITVPSFFSDRLDGSVITDNDGEEDRSSFESFVDIEQDSVTSSDQREEYGNGDDEMEEEDDSCGSSSDDQISISSESLAVTVKNLERQESVQMNRTNMTIFHFVMTAPKWSLSLFLFLAARSVPLLTPNEGVSIPVIKLRTLVTQESTAYLTCTQRRFDSIDDSLESIASLELDRVSEVRSRNKQLILDSTQIADSCVNATRQARNSLVQWREDGMNLDLVSDEDKCSRSQKDKLNKFLGEEFRVVENELGTVFDEYASGSHKSLEYLRTYSEDRMKYDVDYFVIQRIQPVLDLLQNQTGIHPFHAFLDHEDLELRIRNILEQLEASLLLVQSHVDVLKLRIDSLTHSISEFHAGYMDLYGRIIDGADFVVDVLPPGVPLPDIFDLSAVPIGDSLLPTISYMPDIEAPLSQALAALESMASQTLSLLMEVAKEVELQASSHLRGVSVDFSTELTGMLVLEDYDPPKFIGSTPEITNPLQELDFNYALGEVSRSKADELISRIRDFDRLESEGVTIKPPVQKGNITFEEESTTFDYLRTRFPSVSIPDLFAALTSWLLVNTWVIEIVVQSLRMWRLERSYSRGAVPDLPEIDYGSSDDEKKERSTRTLFFKSFLRTLSVPWTLLMFVFFPIGVISVTVWYPHVHAKCELSRDGTFLANNFLSPLLINEASARGNALYLSGEFQCHKMQRKMCSDMQANGELLARMDEASIRSLQLRHDYASTKIDLLETCVDSSINEMYHEGCCGLKGYRTMGCSETELACPIDESVYPRMAFRPLVEYTSEPACSFDGTNEWVLEDARFNCTTMVQECNRVSCQGVNQDLLRSEIIETDCAVETYLIRCFLFFMVVLYHAIVINFICTITFTGIRQIRWKQLCPDGIKLLTNVEEDGTLVKGKTRKERADRIAPVLVRFERLGKLQISIGAATSLLWFISIFVIKA